MAEEPPSRVEWTVVEAGDGLTRLRLVHGDLAFSPLTWANVQNGWVWVLDSMKTLIETGRPLPDPVELDKVDPPTDGDWHRTQAIAANNAVWELVGKPDRAEDDQESMLRSAYAAAYHWQRATGSTPANEARASYLIAKALVLTGQPAASLRSARRSLQVCLDHELVDFDLAYAHEACARAHLALDQPEEAAAAWGRATAVPIVDAEDRQIVQADFADYPG